MLKFNILITVLTYIDRMKCHFLNNNVHTTIVTLAKIVLSVMSPICKETALVTRYLKIKVIVMPRKLKNLNYTIC
jgi:hypothetical protein